MRDLRSRVPGRRKRCHLAALPGLCLEEHADTGCHRRGFRPVIPRHLREENRVLGGVGGMSEPLVAALADLLAPDLERLVRELVEHELAAVAVPEPDPWMTTSEAAHYLRLSPEALRARVRRGTVPAHRDDHRWLFHR